MTALKSHANILPLSPFFNAAFPLKVAAGCVSCSYTQSNVLLFYLEVTLMEGMEDDNVLQQMACFTEPSGSAETWSKGGTFRR